MKHIHLIAIIPFTFLISLFASVLHATQAELKSGSDILDEVNKQITNIDTRELLQILDDEPDTIVIDVRTADEIARLGGMIRSNRNYNITRGWLEFRIRDIAHEADTPIVVYCGINQRSPLTALALQQMGYTNVKNYAEGFFTWKQDGLPLEETDKAPDSILYSKPIQVTDNVWSAIGATAPPSYENAGHNNNLSFIITDDGVVVVNASDNYLLAQSLHRSIKAITDKPVKYVILENAQGHAALGTSYWQEQGAAVIAHVDAKHELEEYGEQILERIQRGRRDKAEGTRLSLPDITFEDKHIIELGDERIELLHLGPTHSPGDIVVWLPEQRLVIAGDMAFHERLLPVTEHTDTAGWLDSWDKFAALDARIVIPGHGGPTDMAEVTRYTRDYLAYMREQIGRIIDEGGTLEESANVDQSAYRHLDTFDELSALNASTMFRQMEFE
jgi:glyoxylase-like metal-dependent hydrolase (beta-lactamase superfamily II)/rhodanese-related sulfurtransferase